MEYRDLGLLKLFFAELGEPEDMQALALEQAEAQRRQVAEYEAIEERYANRPEFATRLLTVRLGTRLARVVRGVLGGAGRERHGQWAYGTPWHGPPPQRSVIVPSIRR